MNKEKRKFTIKKQSEENEKENKKKKIRCGRTMKRRE